jgi:hypothetical protein
MADAPTPSRDQQFVAKLLAMKGPIGSEARKVAREMFPDAAIPAEDPNDVVEQAVAPVKTEVDALKTQLASALDRLTAKEKADTDLRAENDLRVNIERAASGFGLTESGRTKMMERMQATGNTTDAEAAAAWVVSQMPKPEPTSTPTWLPTDANLFGTKEKDTQFEALHTNPQKYMDDQLRAFAADPEKYTRETFGNA